MGHEGCPGLHLRWESMHELGTHPGWDKKLVSNHTCAKVQKRFSCLGLSQFCPLFLKTAIWTSRKFGASLGGDVGVVSLEACARQRLSQNFGSLAPEVQSLLIFTDSGLWCHFVSKHCIGQATPAGGLFVAKTWGSPKLLKIWGILWKLQQLLHSKEIKLQWLYFSCILLAKNFWCVGYSQEYIFSKVLTEGYFSIFLWK